MSFGTTEGDVDGNEIEYEPFVPKDPMAGEPTTQEPVAQEPVAQEPVVQEPVAQDFTAQEPTVEMGASGPSEPFPPPVPPKPAPAPKGRSTKRAAVLGGVAGAAVAALIVGSVAVARDNGSSSTSASAPVTTAAPSGGGASGSGSGSAAPSSASTPTPSAPLGVAPTMDIRAVLRKVEPSVVAIETNLVSPNGGIFGRGAGTGVIISTDGLVLTNNHVIDQAGSIKVKLADGRELSADLVGSSPADDVALIKIRDVSGLTAAELGSSAELQVGDSVVAIGNALDLEGTPTVTEGIVSALNRSIDAGSESGSSNGESLSNLIQTDAAINPGNSGGPLVNASGQVVGIDTAIIGDAQNIGFAIAIDSIKPLITDIQNGKSSTTSTAFLGVSSESVSDLDQATIDQFGITADSGAVVVNTTPGTAADEVGLQQGDVITSIDGKAVTSSDDLGTAIRSHKPGDKVTIEYQRNGDTKSGTATLGSRASGN
jgi:putative serine protease PepD